MLNDKWVEYFFNIAEVVASKSKDTSTKVGSVLVGTHNQVIATGFNGLPPKCEDDPELYPERYARDKYKYLVVNHSESAAISLAARHGVATDKATMFITLSPCIDCCKQIITAGIKAIYYKSATGTGGWREHLPLAHQLLKEAEVEIHEYFEHENPIYAKHMIYYKGYALEYDVSEKECEIHYGGKGDMCESNASFYKADSIDMIQAALDFAKDNIDNALKEKRSNDDGLG